MPLRFFWRERSTAAQRERQEKVERAVADGFRQLSEMLKKAADLVEARRLYRSGYEKQEKYLERAGPKDPR